MIPFNKPYLSGKELEYIEHAVSLGKISGNGYYTNKCQVYFEKYLGCKKTLLTTSCTDALEMCAILLDIKEGDEVIMPSYTFVSTANAFVLRGAKIVFCDSKEEQPNIDEEKIEDLISEKTKAIVVVHYAGVSCEMDVVMEIANKYDLFVVEDAAQAIDSYYNEKPLGSIGHLSAFSFHETKNIQCGEGGLLAINDENFVERAEIIWEKGTNRTAFFRGEVDKYGWVDIGSSFLPSELNAAFLWAQLENLQSIQCLRKNIWNTYYDFFRKINNIRLPIIPEYASNNAHMFYFVCNSVKERNLLLDFLKKRNVLGVFHYQSLHKSSFYCDEFEGDQLINVEMYSNQLVRLPMYPGLSTAEHQEVLKVLEEFFC